MSRRSSLLLLGVAVSILPASGVRAWQATEARGLAGDERGTFQLDRGVEIELRSPGREALRIEEDDKANARLPGLGTESYPAGDRSDAQSAAKVILVKQDESSIDIKLDAFSKVRGWSQARGTARATIAMQVPPEIRKLPALLRLTASKPGDVAIIVTAPDGSRIAPIEGKPGEYLIPGGIDGKVMIQSAVTAEAGDQQSAGTEAIAQSVSLRAFVERGPILFGLPQTQFIYRGFETDEYPQVGSILLDGMIHCTATLVAPRTILTAAHCVAGYESQIRQGRFKFAIGKRASAPEATVAVTQAAYPQDANGGYFYNASTHADDIAVAYLETSSTVAPAAVHGGTPGWAVFQSEQLLFVGYGFNGSQPNSAGIKRQASWRVGQVEPRRVTWQTTGASTCAFDSGGPAFRESPLLLVAVTSMGAEDCTAGVNTRVDAYAAWLSGKLR